MGNYFKEEKMKQHITVKQLNQLSEKGKKKLLEWERKKRYDNFDDYAERVGKEPSTLSTLSIGQMIEFLIEHNKEKESNAIWINWDDKSLGCFTCDEYWELVKKVLDK